MDTVTNAQRTTMTWEHLMRARDAYTAAVGGREAPLEGKWPAITRSAVIASGCTPGLKVVTLPPTVARRLTFWGSLKGWLQGRGWQTETWVPNPCLPAAGAFYRLGDVLYCREEDYAALKRATREFP